MHFFSTVGLLCFRHVILFLMTHSRVMFFTHLLLWESLCSTSYLGFIFLGQYRSSIKTNIQLKSTFRENVTTSQFAHLKQKKIYRPLRGPNENQEEITGGTTRYEDGGGDGTELHMAPLDQHIILQVNDISELEPSLFCNHFQWRVSTDHKP